LASLYLFFGGFGLFFGVMDVRFFRLSRQKADGFPGRTHPKNERGLDRLSDGFSGCWTGADAFVFLDIPSVIGTIYIVHWRRKVEGQASA
ncbi:MAG: hypothetical protein D6772_12755, partial [Bacteroidetes bacterium]